MKTLINIGKVYGKKDGAAYIILKVFNSDVDNRHNVNSLDEVLAVPETEGAVFTGQNVDEYLVSVDDINSGKVEIDGKLFVGCEVRVFLEGSPARVSYIKAKK